ncbi:MAG: class I SAM-dependent methyltransferase [Candidatus Eisenbacteria bacterium]
MSFEGEARFFCTLLPPGRSPRPILVVGCGEGVEAAAIARETGAIVVGLDLVVDARHRHPGVHLLRADARAMPFRDGVFDALYCYHVLEHVPDPGRAVGESRRVLGPGGLAFFGTPNKSRLVGYLGGRGTAPERLWWNVVDWGRRVSGRWSNELGAHAGFTGRELATLLAGAFGSVREVSVPYYTTKYPRLAAFWIRSFRLGIGRWLAPSVYFVAGDANGA